ncbi:hypothetical protein PQR46_25255 [Paraburkholderia sediminicola]|uniref:hypothetical protein n=1 Tax=Paraburkholderia TaxID=1822464 RepID=UPI0038B849B0
MADGQVAILKSQKASEVVELEEKRAKERRFREALKRNLAELLASVTENLSITELFNLTADEDGSTLAVGKAEFEVATAEPPRA